MSGGDYGRVRHTFWTDPDIKRGLTPEQKALLLYYFTSPHSNLAGIYYCPLGYVSLETGISLERVEEWTIGPLARYVTYDAETEEVFVHRAGKHQVGDDLKAGDKRVKAITKAVGETHSVKLVNKFLTTYAHWPLGMAPPLSPDPEPLDKPLDKPLRSQSSAVAVQCNNKAVAEPLTETEPATADDPLTACVSFVAENGYGARERLIAQGEDSVAWRDTKGTPVPDADRLRLLKLAHARVQDRQSHDLRSALRYVIPQQYDPTQAPTAAELSERRKPPEPTPVTAPRQTVSDIEAKRADQEAAYRNWKQRVRSRLDAEPEDVREQLWREARAEIGDVGIRMIPAPARERTIEAKALEIYGNRIADPQPEQAA